MPAAADRLPFRLPDFTRVMWTSDRARDVWQPRIDRIRKGWLAVERRTVTAGLRPCTMQHAAPRELPALAAEAGRNGLCALPLALEGVPSHGYATEASPPGTGRSSVFRVASGAPANVARLQSAWAAGRHVEVGRLLGYPECCTSFFQRVWIEEQSVDTTWAMAGTPEGDPAPRALDVAGPPEANILLRWLGVRAVAHLPCRFDCDATVRVADEWLMLARECGLSAEADWLLEMLSWPCEWSALHGIAEIKTPIAKIAARTDATAHKLVVRRHGDRYPAEGARGLVFPYRRPPRRDEPAVHPVAVLRRGREWLFADNGFTSASAMRAAHRPIVDLASRHIGAGEAAVLDTGCGNGALLAAVCERVPGAIPGGIDVAPDKIARARALLPRFASRFAVANLFDAEAPWRHQQADLVLLMPGRLLEVDDRRREDLLEWLARTRCAVLVYAYDDWLDRYGGLEALARAGGLRVQAGAGATAALAAVGVPAS